MGEDAMAEAELIVFNGKIWTGQPLPPPGAKLTPATFAEAVAVANGRFLAVGSSEQISRAE
jgi:predicted amidohydrolase YtcJ